MVIKGQKVRPLQYILSKGDMQMNKTELVKAVAEKAGLKQKESERAVKATIEAIAEALAKKDKVQLIGFGTFEVRERKARIGHNPATQEEIKIPASKTPAFRPAKMLKNLVNAKEAAPKKAKKAKK